MGIVEITRVTYKKFFKKNCAVTCSLRDKARTTFL